jgi:glycosyltransferase involved in cell wall biosynthesis
MKPVISVIIPVRNLSYYLLFETLPALSKQSYKHFEVILLPNEKSEYDNTLIKTYAWLHIIPTGKKKPAEKRNIGVYYAKGGLIAFLDDDAYPPHQWLQEAYRLYSKQKEFVFCGPGIIPQKASKWEKIFDETINSSFGSALNTISHRFQKEEEKYIDDYPTMNFFIQKKLFNKIGGFQKKHWPGEDSKLCNTLVYEKNQQILYTSKLFVYHHRRNNLKLYLLQHANYGYHRGLFYGEGDQNSQKIMYLIPSVFVGYLIVFLLYSLFIFIDQSIFFPFLYFLFIIPFFIYCGVLIYIALKTLQKTKQLLISLGVIPTTFLTHFTYGISFVQGYMDANYKIPIYVA